MEPIQLDTTTSVRNSQWLAVCPTCQCERIVTYCQAFNIRKGKSKVCMNCRPKPKFIPRSGKGPIKREYNASQAVKMSYINFWGGGFVSEEGREKQRQAKLGRYGDKASRWQGGKTSIALAERSKDAYKQLRSLVFKRDNFTCQSCNVRGGRLEMHHVKEWRNYPELRFVVDNCKTLCKGCHKTTDNYGHKAIKKVA